MSLANIASQLDESLPAHPDEGEPQLEDVARFLILCFAGLQEQGPDPLGELRRERRTVAARE